jgi:N-methylhydantoinase B
MPDVDPFTLEVLRSTLPSIPNEMSHVLRRTSYNVMIYEVGDYCCAILDHEGNLIGQNAGGVSHFLADLGVVVRDGLERLKTFSPGDVIVTNHSAVCGQHLNNVCVYQPFIYEGVLRGFAITRAHWTDIGGHSTGSGVSNAATDPWLEGLQLNQLKLYRAGEPNEEILGIIKDNIRFPESSMGDLRSQVASCQLGINRLHEVFAKYGQDIVLESVRRIFDETEARCRNVVRGFADGHYTYESSFRDNVAATEGPIEVKAEIDIAGDHMTIDLSKCSPQRKGIFNSRTLAAPYIAFKALTAPLDPVNEGSFRALTVILPEGTFMMAKYPAAMGGWSLPLPTVIDTILAALAGALPERIPAAHKGYLGDQLTFFSSDPKTGKRFVAQSIEGGGWGGRPFEDGPSASVTVCQGDVRNSPIEVLERKFPIVVEERALRVDSGGAGKFRGGLGHQYRVRNLVPGAWNLRQSGRQFNPAWGLWGGHNGAPSERLARPAGAPEFVNVESYSYEVAPQSQILVRSGGGGGWGDPLQRDPSLVLRDVADGFISPAAARDEYGVAIAPGSLDRGGLELVLDEAETAKLRGVR